MFSSNLFGRFAKFYPYPYSQVKFLLPFNCRSSMRSLATKKPTTLGQGRRPPLKTPKSIVGKQKTNVAINAVKSAKGLKTKKKSFNTRNINTEIVAPSSTLNTGTNSSTMGNRAKSLPTRIGTFEGLKEFFSHPLTWDRNNGYLNVLLALAIFSYSFCSNCKRDTKSGKNGGK